MRRDHIRDYATEAYRFYAKTGGTESYIKTLLDDLQKHKGSGICSPTESALISKEAIIEAKQSELADLDAVDKVLAGLMLSGNENTIKAITCVYFRDCWKDLGKGDIEARVNFAEIHIPASRAQVYRWLRTARREFAKERGLRV